MSERTKVCIGIDPGEKGGISFLSNGAAKHFKLEGATPADIYAELLGWCEGEVDVFAHIEAIAVFPRKGPDGRPQMGVGEAIRLTKLFRSQGVLIGLLVAAGIPYEEVRPSEWQKHLGCRTKGDKKITYRKAQELFPGYKVTHAIADSLLLAEHCRRTVNQRNGAIA